MTRKRTKPNVKMKLKNKSTQTSRPKTDKSIINIGLLIVFLSILMAVMFTVPALHSGKTEEHLMKKNNPTVGIKIEGGSDNTIRDNMVSGFDEGISAKNVTRLNAQNNSVFNTPKATFWLNGWVKWLSGILAAVVAGYLIHRFKWN